MQIVVTKSVYRVLLFTLVDCQWGDWEIGSCSVTCGGGTQTNSRGHLQPALFNGTECEGPATEQIECNIDPCPGIKEF